MTCYSNIAQCQLKLNRPEEGLEYCNKALATDNMHVKSLFRKGQALLQLKHYDEALNCFEKSLRLDPTNNSVTNEIKKLKVLIKRNQEMSEKKLAKALGKMGEGGLYG